MHSMDVLQISRSIRYLVFNSGNRFGSYKYFSTSKMKSANDIEYFKAFFISFDKLMWYLFLPNIIFKKEHWSTFETPKHLGKEISGKLRFR